MNKISRIEFTRLENELENNIVAIPFMSMIGRARRFNIANGIIFSIMAMETSPGDVNSSCLFKLIKKENKCAIKNAIAEPKINSMFVVNGDLSANVPEYD